MSRARVRKRLRRLAQRNEPPYSSPGVLAPPADATQTVINLFHYSASAVQERVSVSVGEATAELAAGTGVLWIHVAGLADVGAIEQLMLAIGLDRLIMADIVAAQHRPKVDATGDLLTVLMRLPPKEPGVSGDQFALVLGRNLVVTFDEHHGDCFDAVRQRIREGGRLCSLGADHLAYRLIDVVVDGFFPLLEAEGEGLERLEDGLADIRTMPPLQDVHGAKRRLLGYRRAIWPLREILSALMRDHPDLVGPEARRYLRDTYDHVIELIDLLEIYRETAGGLAELSLALVNTRMNDVMKLLAVISTIFMPLTFIAGVYGMNFDTHASRWNMPELHWPFGYPLAMGVMALIAFVLIFYFRWRGFIGRHGTTFDADT